MYKVENASKEEKHVAILKQLKIGRDMTEVY